MTNTDGGEEDQQKTYKKRWGRQPKSDWKLLRGKKSAKKLPTVMEGGEEVTESDGGGQLKGDGEGGWPMQLAKCDAIFMDFIWNSSNEINSSPPFLKVLWGPQVFRLVSGTTILAPFNAFWDIFEVAREGNVAQNTPKMTKFCF